MFHPDTGMVRSEPARRTMGGEVIVTAAGMKIYPEDIEQVLDRQPEVKACTVVAGEGPNGPEPIAVLILRHHQADVKAIIDRANRSLAQYQHIRRWFIWPDEDFPRTPTQKVRKGLVKERVMAALTGASHPETLPAGASADRAVQAPALLAGVHFGRLLLQCLLDAAKERIPAKLRVCR